MAFVLNFICMTTTTAVVLVTTLSKSQTKPAYTLRHLFLACLYPLCGFVFPNPDPSVLMGSLGSAADLMLDKFVISSPGVELLKQSNYSSLFLLKLFFFFFTFLGVISVDYLRSSYEFHLNEFICFNGG